MSRTFYAYAEEVQTPVGSYGPLDELHDLYHVGTVRRLDPTPEQLELAGWCEGPNFANANAAMILRSLGLDPDRSVFARADLYSRVVTALAVPPFSDDGTASVRDGNFIDCGHRPGWFHDAYEAIADLCEAADRMGIHEIVCA